METILVALAIALCVGTFEHVVTKQQSIQTYEVTDDDFQNAVRWEKANAQEEVCSNERK